MGPPVTRSATCVVPEQRVAVLHRRARGPDVALLDGELALLLVLRDPDQPLDVVDADGAHATTPFARRSAIRGRAEAGGGQQRDRCRCRAGSPATTGSSGAAMPASTGPTWRNRAGPSPPPAARAGGGHRLDDGVTGRVLLVVDQLGHRQHRGHAGVGPGQLGHPGVAVLGGEGGPEVGPDLVLDLVVELVVDPLLAAEEPAQVGEELGLDGPDRQPPAVGRLVGVVAGVPAGDDVVARARPAPRWPGARRRPAR